MSLESVQKYFANTCVAKRVIVFDTPTASVAQAAQAHSVNPDKIAKTLALGIDDTPILVVISGMAKIDNKKYAHVFTKKAKMLNKHQIFVHIGHPIGGICPFGLQTPIIDVFLDVSLKKHQEVILAAGSVNASIKLSIAELERYTLYTSWVDVCK